MTRLERRKASSARGSSSASIPVRIRSLARPALARRSLATCARFPSAAADPACPAIQAAYPATMGSIMARNAATDPAAARASMPSSTPGISLGTTFSTSAVGIHAVRASRQQPAVSVTATAETLCPTACSYASRYCRSATCSSQSSLSWPRRFGRGTKGCSMRSDSSGWKMYAWSRVRSGAGTRWLTRKTETERVPGGTRPRDPVSRTEVTI